MGGRCAGAVSEVNLSNGEHLDLYDTSGPYIHTR
jgi:hypothetical protein